MGCDPVKGCPPDTHNVHCAFPHCAKGQRQAALMPTERVVEVVCEGCGGNGWFSVTVPVCCGRPGRHGDCCGDPEPSQGQEVCVRCGGAGRESTTLAPSSLAAAMLTLAEAVLERDAADVLGQMTPSDDAVIRWEKAQDAYLTALAAVRNHKDYRATCPRCGKHLDPAVNGVHTCNARRPE